MPINIVSSSKPQIDTSSSKTHKEASTGRPRGLPVDASFLILNGDIGILPRVDTFRNNLNQKRDIEAKFLFQIKQYR